MRHYSVSLVDASSPKEQWSHEQRLAKAAKLKSLLSEMMEMNLTETGFMEELRQLDAESLGLSELSGSEVLTGSMQTEIDHLLSTYEDHQEQRKSLMHLLEKALIQIDETALKNRLVI